jgi:hypothetical protein
MNRIQNFPLHPKHSSQVDGKQVYDKDISCTIKRRKLVRQIEIELSKVWISNSFSLQYRTLLVHLYFSHVVPMH